MKSNNEKDVVQEIEAMDTKSEQINDNDEKNVITRRKFLGLLTGIPVALGIGTTLLLAGGAFYPSTTLRPIPPKMVVAKEDEMDGKPKEIVYDGIPAILFKNGGEYKAFSRVCTHLGCTVMWNESEKQFECPCHGGVFDENGNVVLGPPPKPLLQLKAWAEEGYVMVQKEVV